MVGAISARFGIEFDPGKATDLPGVATRAPGVTDLTTGGGPHVTSRSVRAGVGDSALGKPITGLWLGLLRGAVGTLRIDLLATAEADVSGGAITLDFVGRTGSGFGSILAAVSAFAWGAPTKAVLLGFQVEPIALSGTGLIPGSSAVVLNGAIAVNGVGTVLSVLGRALAGVGVAASDLGKLLVGVSAFAGGRPVSGVGRGALTKAAGLAKTGLAAWAVSLAGVIALPSVGLADSASANVLPLTAGRTAGLTAGLTAEESTKGCLLRGYVRPE